MIHAFATFVHFVTLSPCLPARGFAATFLDDLDAKMTALGVATGLKVGGNADQVAGTAGLDFYVREGMKAVRILRPILREHLKDDPALLAAWNSAAQVVRSAGDHAGPCARARAAHRQLKEGSAKRSGAEPPQE